MTRASNKRLTLFSEEEQFALYGLPDFNPEQRVHFLTLTESEREHVDAQDGLCAQLSLALQIGYFKAKHLLFNFHWSDIPHDDIEFLLKNYFPKKVWKNPTPVKKHVYYHQRDLVMQLFNYQPWSTKQSERLSEKLTELLRLNASQAFILTETVSWLHKERIVRPAYTKLQDLFSQVFHVERQRLQGLIEENLIPESIQQLQQLLATDTTLSELSALREDIKSFRFRMMQSEQRKLALLRPLYEIAQQLLPKLGISQQNICYYASLAHFYAVTRLREMEPWQTNLYLLCYNLCTELNRLWRTFNRKLKKGQFPHLTYDKKTTTLNIRKIRGMISDQPQHQIYYKLPACDITDLLTFVEEKCAFLKAFTPLQSYSSKKMPEKGDIFACLLAQALNHGMGKMADISDISYDKLRETLQQYLRADTLKAANDKLIHTIEALSIFAYYDIDLVTRYASLDGQKYTQVRPTAKARYSKKYFGTGRGVVAYTLLCNHVPLQTDIIGAHEHESYYALDILQSNTSAIIPQAVTGDMHSVNKANFALLDWFDFLFSPRFTNLKTEIKRIYCGDDMENYRKYLIQPAGQINRKLIEENWPELQRIIVTLNQKEITQASIVKKLCTYTYANPIRKALFEYDKLIRSIYTLKYLMDPNLQRQVQRSQNRIESYHQLRGAISEVNGKKELAGNTDVEVEISNECGRLIANAIIYYNSAILSKLLEKYQAEDNQKGLSQLERISPIAWQHIHLLGHYVFNQTVHGIDLDQLIAELRL